MSKNPELFPDYWNKQFEEHKQGWNIGYASPPLVEYFNQIKNKEIQILVPGAGHGWEAEYLYQQGFKNTYVLDFSPKAVEIFKHRYSEFPVSQIFVEDFFFHNNKYDLIVEHTFFTSFPYEYRPEYAQKMHQLLHPAGKLVGLWFTHRFQQNYPPYGGTKEEYEAIFGKYFSFKTFEIAYNSIKPRKGREFFMLMQKK